MAACENTLIKINLSGGTNFLEMFANFLRLIPFLLYLGFLLFVFYIIFMILNLMKQRNEYLKDIRDEIKKSNKL